MLRVIKSFFILFLCMVFVYAGYGFVYGNFHKIDKNVYRSAQLFSFNMPYYIEKYHVVTILNLRGEKPKQTWFQYEQKVTKLYHIKHISHKISARKYLDFNQTSTLVNILKKAKKPLLIHCEGGADRTSLVSALYRYAVLHQSKEEALKELQWFYGHLPWLRPQVIAMEKSFENYVQKSKQ